VFFRASASCSKILNDKKYTFNTVNSRQTLFSGQAQVVQKSWMIKNIFNAVENFMANSFPGQCEKNFNTVYSASKRNYRDNTKRRAGGPGGLEGRVSNSKTWICSGLAGCTKGRAGHQVGSAGCTFVLSCTTERAGGLHQRAGWRATLKGGPAGCTQGRAGGLQSRAGWTYTRAGGL